MTTYNELKFSKEVATQLDYYVYRLIDPRNGQTFYVGKGKGNRIFQHVMEQLKQEDDANDEATNGLSLKLSTIQEIHKTGLNVLHLIHRHGLSETEVFEVESALMDAYPGLTNIQNGSNSDRGCASVYELKQRYESSPINIQHNLLEICINRSFEDTNSVYDAVRYAWTISTKNAMEMDYVVAVVNGVVKEVFKTEEWLPATEKNFPKLYKSPLPKRHGFVGHSAPKEIQELYCGKHVPKRAKGAAIPFRYHYK